MFEAYVEQMFAPIAGGRGYISQIRSYPGLTEEEAKAKARELRKEWDQQATETYSFYCGVRAERTVK